VARYKFLYCIVLYDIQQSLCEQTVTVLRRVISCFLHGYCYTGDVTFNVLFLKFGGPTGTEMGGRLPDPIVIAVYASLRDVQSVEPGRDGSMI